MAAPTTDTPTESGDKQIFLTMRELGVKDETAYTFTQGVMQTAGQNVLAEVRFQGEKLAAQNAKLAAEQRAETAKLAAQLDAQQREIGHLRWMIGGGFVLIGIIITVVSLLS